MPNRGEGSKGGAAWTVESGEKYRLMYRDWVAGWSWSDLAAKYQLSERRCQEVIHELRMSNIDVLGLGGALMGIRYAEDLILKREHAIGQAGEYLRQAIDENVASVAVAWHRRRAKETDALVDLLMALGYLPRNLGVLKDVGDVNVMGEALMDALNESVPREDIERFLRILRLRLSPDSNVKLEVDGRPEA